MKSQILYSISYILRSLFLEVDVGVKWGNKLLSSVVMTNNTPDIYNAQQGVVATE
jgi:hypothetical protein